MTTVAPDFEPTNVPGSIMPDAPSGPGAPAVPDAPVATDPSVTPAAPSAGASSPRAGFHLSLAGFQTFVGLTAGLLSIMGALLTVPRVLGASKGDVITIVREARTEKALPGAAVEILSHADSAVTTLRVDTLGRARSSLIQGPYRIRVTHPKYIAEVREVQVLPGQTAEIPVRLRTRSR
jgi:hypothetical protein